MDWKIGMPNLGHTMEEGKVAEWLKRVGDRVAKGEVIAIVETDKAQFDVEAPADGAVLTIDVPAGTTVKVGTVIGSVGTPGEAAPRPALRPRQAATPAARTLAAELGIDLATLTGTGEGGAISRDDVRAAAARAASSGAKAAPAPAAMRRATAEATERAWRTIPHVTLVRRADVTALLAADAAITAGVVRAAALALRAHPRFNGWLLESGYRAAARADIAVAVATEAGLLLPVVRGAETLGVAAIAAEIEALAASARAGTLEGSRTVDASFTLSTLGRWGVGLFTPIISAPQVAIIGVGAVERVAREAPDGSVRFRSELALCLVFDHRANDGAEAAAFLADIAAGLADPALLELPP